MNQHNPGFLRCVRHPSQFFTGFCPSCLVERLSHVGAVEQGSETSLRLKNETPDPERKPATEARVRRTLKLLFQLDDGDDSESKEGVGNEQHVLANSNAFQRGRSTSCYINSSDRACIEITSDTGRGLGIADAANEDINCSEDEKFYEGGVSSGLSSMLSKRGWRLRLRSLSKKDEMHEIGKSSRGYGEKQSQNMQHSFDWRVHQDLSRGSSDPPRHSWDGSMVSKTFACSFNCLEEQQDEARRAKRSFTVEEMAGKSDRDDYINKVNVSLSALDRGKPSSDSLGSLFRESNVEDSHSVNNASKHRRKQSHRWRKVWDWSITSPFRDFGKRHERALGRSLSESWRDGRNIKNMKNVGSDDSLKFNSSKHTSIRPNHRNINAGNDNLVSFGPAWKNKREFKFGQSRSIHYTSPGNLDNGLLRFYLTPLRSSRRCASKGRIKNSRSLTRGIFGFY